MHILAQKNGGVCLSNEYVNSHTSLKWRCKEGHVWKSKPIYVIIGHWCPICGYEKMVINRSGKFKRLSIEKINNEAIKRNGICLSNKYINNSTNLLFKCNKDGYEWSADADHMLRGQWCPKCVGQIKHTLQDMQNIAKERGGKCLSKEYINGKTKLLWECKQNHEWYARYNDILRGRWCPICIERKNEKICRFLFEKIFKDNFPKQRYNWLKSPKNQNLELDGYNKKLKIAFEYQGIQHYNLKGINKNQKVLEYMQLCDQIKRDKCKEKGITLIEVPYTVKHKDMEKYICQKIH